MKILFIFTGGTIGSTLSGGVISADSEKSYKIIDFYRKNYGIAFEYDVIEPYIELSENNTGDEIRMLSRCVAENVCKGYDGIIVTHGTDTLQYSAAALGYTVGLSSIPVCIVSANRPIEHGKSNALDNLRGAVRFIEDKAGKGAFVVYRNDNSEYVRVHRATRLVGVKSFSDDVSSIKGEIYGHFDNDFKFIKNADYRELADETEPLSASGLGAVCDKVAFITPYVGMDYPILPSTVRYVILSTYHSGTLDTKSARANEFFADMNERGIKVYAVGLSQAAPYESTLTFQRLGIIPLYNISPISAYVKLWLLTSVGEDTDMLVGRSLSGDVVPPDIY